MKLPWSGTFHSIANRLIRRHCATVGLDASFSVLDRGDAADLMDVVRHELRLFESGEALSAQGHLPRDLFASRQHAARR